MALNNNIKTFLLYISSVAAIMIIYLAKKALIFSLLVNKVVILAEHLDFPNIFSKYLTKILLKCTRANEYVIQLEKSKQQLYRLIYN